MYGSFDGAASESGGEEKPLVSPSNKEEEDVNNVKVAPINLNDETDGGDDDPPPPLQDEKVTSTVSAASVSSEVTSNDFSLHQAAREGAIDLVKEHIQLMIKRGEYVFKVIDTLNTQKFAPLHLAARFNRKNVLLYLLDQEAHIDIKGGEDNNTPLHLATKFNMMSTARCLCERGADVTIKNTYGTTALHFAARRGNVSLCRLLIDRRCDVNALDNANVSPLHMAMLGGSQQITILLIEHGADLYAKDNEGEMPIHYAAAENQGDLIITLTKGALIKVDVSQREQAQRAFINSVTDEKDTPLHISAQGGYLDTVKSLVTIGARLNLRTDTKSTPLHLASTSGSADVVKFLLMNHARVNVFDDQNMTPFHKACQHGRMDVIKALHEGGAQIDSKDTDSYTPLMCAVWKGQNDVIEYLIEHGAKLNTIDMNAKTLLHIAIEEKHCNTARLLVQKGAGTLVNKADKDFQTPLHFAAKINDHKTIELLLTKNAEVDVGDNKEKTPLHIAAEEGHLESLKLLGEASPGSVNQTDERGRSPLHLSAMNGRIDTCKELIEMGGETSSRDDVNWTPLDYAAQNGHVKTVNVLLDNDAPIDACGKNQATPLHHASANGQLDCIKVLLDRGASISMRNCEGKNCLDLAVENYHNEACLILITHERWEEVMSNVDKEGYHPMEKLIEYAPEVAEVVLNNCIHKSKVDSHLTDYNVRYDFKFLDLPPEEQINENYFGPSNMVKFQRVNLLSHPLTVQLINDKWARLGRWVYMLSLLVYLLFVSLLTALLIIEKQRESKSEQNMFQKAVPWFTILLGFVQVMKECVQGWYLGRHYFKDVANYLEVLLYILTIVFMMPFLLRATNLEEYLQDYNYRLGLKQLKWNVGAIAILLAWSNLLLYLKRFPFFGLYVVMLIEVLKTLLSVIVVFGFIIVAFSLSLFMLLGEQIAFTYVGRALIKTGVMTIGEFEYDSMFSYNATTGELVDPATVPYPAITFLIFVVFLVICPVILMNLLVGLAVGDIEAVRKSAYIHILKAQVHMLKMLENRYPPWVLKEVYRQELTIYPNVKGWKKRFLLWLGESNLDSLKEEQEDSHGKEAVIARELIAQRAELDKQKKRIKQLTELLEEQSKLARDIAQKLDISDDEYED